jgi:hypothetical protein
MKKLLGIIVLGLLLSGNAYADCIKGDCKNGYGEYVFSDGSKYSGYWAKRKKTGEGTYEWANGDKYEGGWKKNNFSGKGTMTTADGWSYSGTWLKDKKHGEGIQTNADGTIIEGTWRKDLYHGVMTTKYTDGTIKVVRYDRGHNHGEIITAESKKKNNEIELASMINEAKNTCKTLGFKEGTEKFTDCSLKLYTQAVENKVALKVAKQKSSNSSNSGSMVIYDPVRDSQNKIDRGMKMLNGGCTLGKDC